jgi:4-amino-4-deoxy-L-arabinose transferase-like glycosyltransferase
MAGASVESFYGAAARSMSENWWDFAFGSFDPWGTVTVDKLPGALWMQALSLRVFGFHIWALVLPQVAEGVLTILVLYRAVRRLAGPAAGLSAAAVLAVTPVTVLLSRGNVSDSLLILLLVLAADATSAALLTGSLWRLLLAGCWVGLAFQAKMMQAWLALPALAAAYLLAAPAARLRTRCAHVALAGLVTVVVSLSWMTAFMLVPAQDRPYADGSPDNSVFVQVFDYNGVSRLTGHLVIAAKPRAPFLTAQLKSGYALTAATAGVRASWHRMLADPFAADSGWLLPAAVAGALCVLFARRRKDRRDPLRAAVVLWGGWWLVLAVFFSAGWYLNSYYVAALVPAVAALCGAGVAACGAGPWPARARLIVAATVLCCAGYGAYLMSGTAAGPVVLIVLTVLASVVAVAAAARLLLPARGSGGHLTMLGFACAAVLLLPAAASVSCVVRELGPFDVPFESAKITYLTHGLAAATPRLISTVHWLEGATPPPAAILGTDTSGLGEDYLLFSGREVLPIGGYEGNLPTPTLATLRSDVRLGWVETFVLPVSPPSPDPRVRWIESHCDEGEPTPPGRPARFAFFYCQPPPSQSTGPLKDG